MATGSKRGMTCTYVVGRYRPAGNFAGQYQKNVPRGSFNRNICKKLSSFIKDIKDGSRKNDFHSVGMDDKFGQEKVASYGEKVPWINNSENAGAETLSDRNTSVSHHHEGKTPSSGKTSKNGNIDDNVIHLDNKPESVEKAEQLINKNKHDKTIDDGKKRKGKSSQNIKKYWPIGNSLQKLKGGTLNSTKVKNSIATAGSMGIFSGAPLSRMSSKKRNQTVGQKFLIKTNYEPSGSQRQIDSNPEEFVQLGLRAHNEFRKIHRTPELVLDLTLSQEAEEYAKILAERGSLIHSKTGGKYGENLAMGCTSKKEEMSAEEATKHW